MQNIMPVRLLVTSILTDFLLDDIRRKYPAFITSLLMHNLLLIIATEKILLLLIFACTQLYTLQQLLSKHPKAFTKLN